MGSGGWRVGTEAGGPAERITHRTPPQLRPRGPLPAQRKHTAGSAQGSKRARRKEGPVKRSGERPAAPPPARWAQGYFFFAHLAKHLSSVFGWSSSCKQTPRPRLKPRTLAPNPIAARTLPSISPAFLVEFSIALMRDACSLQLFSSMQLNRVCGGREAVVGWSGWNGGVEWVCGLGGPAGAPCRTPHHQPPQTQSKYRQNYQPKI